jgi:hypothetical protein
MPFHQDDPAARSLRVALVVRDEKHWQAGGRARGSKTSMRVCSRSAIASSFENGSSSRSTRLRENHAGQRDPRLLAARQRLGIAVVEAFEIHDRRVRFGDPPTFAAAPDSRRNGESRFSPDRHVRKQQRVLEQDPGVAFFGGSAVRSIPSTATLPLALNTGSRKPPI